MVAPSACVLAAVLLVVLGASGVEPASGAVYVCGSDTLLVDPVGSWEAVVLHLDGRLFLLPQTMAASGVRYSDGERTFWTKGETAFLEIGGVVAKRGCVLMQSALEDPHVPGGIVDLPVFSRVSVDVAPFNERLRTASAAGEAWTEDAARIASEYVGGLEGRVVAFLEVDDAGEGATGSTVTLIREGLLDDSVRGIWDELRLERADGGEWQLMRAYRAYRCWRGDHGESYSAEPCL